MALTLERRGKPVSRKRVQRLMWVMGLGAIYRQPRISRPTPEQRVYPYLLRDVRTTQPNQSLPPRRRGCGRRTSPTCLWPGDSCTWWRSWIGTAGTWWPGGCPTPPDRGQALEAGFCAEALTEALGRGRPEVFNTDQGSQFTSREFTQMLEDSGVKISMDGKGPDADALLQQTLGDAPAGVAEGAGYYGGLRMGQEVGFLTFLGS